MKVSIKLIIGIILKINHPIQWTVLSAYLVFGILNILLVQLKNVESRISLYQSMCLTPNIKIIKYIAMHDSMILCLYLWPQNINTKSIPIENIANINLIEDKKGKNLFEIFFIEINFEFNTKLSLWNV